MQTKRLASIDIGTNTVRLLIADIPHDKKIIPIAYERVITRLGGNFKPETGIDKASAERTIKAIDGFGRAIRETGGVAAVFAVATSVVRRAVNKDLFIAEVLKRTGIMIRVISGVEEAAYSLAGVLSVVGANWRSLVFDIGGGSTEFIATEGAATKGSWSMDMGVVHLTEGFLKKDPPGHDELTGLNMEINRVLTALLLNMENDGIDPAQYSTAKGAALAGTAGTITTLAAMAQGLEIYDQSKINRFILKKDDVSSAFNRLSVLTLEQRKKVLTLEKGREDLIVAGAEIALSVMERFAFDGLIVSDAGLLEGVLIEKTQGFTPGNEMRCVTQ
ncbi:MAG: exopolyphosphatase [Deltaproteobacteria bacterium]